MKQKEGSDYFSEDCGNIEWVNWPHNDSADHRKTQCSVVYLGIDFTGNGRKWTAPRETHLKKIIAQLTDFTTFII